MLRVILFSCFVSTWADAEVDVISPHAGGSVSDSGHVGVKLHCTQRVLGSAAVHHTVVIQVTLQMKTNRRDIHFH